MDRDPAVVEPGTAGGLLGLSGYQWLVVAAGWAGWGFDVFDALLFNFVAPNCVPVLLRLPLGSPEARQATLFWTGAITSILLIGWAAGGVLFGWVADRIGRKRALFVTIAIYAVGTALCAAATSIWQLVVFRAIASLGIGGEWGIGATLVAETVPESRRVEAGVIIQTSSPLGIVLASAVNYEVAGVWLASTPQTSWRYVFLAGLVPLIVAAGVRLFIHESERWVAGTRQRRSPTPRELFRPDMRAATLSGFVVAVTALLTWWGCNAFIPLLGITLAGEHAAHLDLSPAAMRLVAEAWKSRASNAFNFGGFLGSLAAVPLARLLGRRPMFIAYFLYSSLALLATFGLDLEPQTRLAMLFLVGVGVYGVFGTFPFYLPELFPARLRATGAGFCYNIGRVFAAAGPLIVGSVSSAAGSSSAGVVHALFWLGLIPLATALAARFLIIETRGRRLPV